MRTFSQNVNVFSDKHVQTNKKRARERLFEAFFSLSEM